MTRLVGWIKNQTHSTQTRLTDFTFISGLLILVGLLSRFRGPEVLENGALVAAACIAAAGLVALWVWMIRRIERDSSPDHISQLTRKPRQWSNFYRALTVAGFLLLITILAFYIPMTKGFWHGYDDATILSRYEVSDYWNIADLFWNRPFAYIGGTIALGFSPDSIDGFFWLAVMLRFGTGVAVYGILQQAFPRSKPIPLIAAIFFIVNPSEPGRFFVVALIGYAMSTFIMTLAVALYLYSFRHRSGWLLVLSCMLLGMALLSWEAGYPLALLIPFLLWLAAPRQSHWLAWTYAWLGMTSVLAARFIAFLLTTNNSYQLETAGEPLTSAGQLLENLSIQLRPTLSFLTLPEAEGRRAFLVYGAVAMVIVAVLLWFASRRSRILPSSRPFLIGIPFAALAVFLGIVAYFKFPYVIRTQFFASPAQAVLWALLIGLVGTFLSRRIQRFWLIAAASGIVFLSVASTMSLQSSSVSRGVSVHFEKLVYVYQQVHQIAPDFEPDTLIIFVSDSFSDIPFRVDYNISVLTNLVLETNAISSALDPLGWQPVFTPDGVVFLHSIAKQEYGYDELIAFDLAPDGRVTLLETLPASLLPEDVSAEGYNPTARIIPGESTSLRFLRYSPWMTPYDPDTIVQSEIIVPPAPIRLGDGWYPFETFNQETFRWVNTDAKIIFSAPLPTPTALNFLLEAAPRADGSPLMLQILDSEGRQIGEYTVVGRQTLSIDFPASADPATYRLHVENSVLPTEADPRTLNFRVFQIESFVRPDIINPSAPIRLGDGWYPFETFNQQTFRWVNNDAEIIFSVPSSTPKLLNFEVEPGYHPDGNPIVVQVLDEQDGKIGEYTITGHQTLSIEFPAAATLVTYRLHVEDSVLPTETDPRILNFRVFRIDAIPAPDIVAPSAEVSLGNGWYPYEIFNQETFRWVNNDAEIIFRVPSPTPKLLNFEVEAAPRADGSPLMLQVLDSEGRQIGEYTVVGRQTLSIDFPASADPATYRLHVENSVLPTASDPRTLNFRVFGISETPVK